MLTTKSKMEIVFRKAKCQNKRSSSSSKHTARHPGLKQKSLNDIITRRKYVSSEHHKCISQLRYYQLAAPVCAGHFVIIDAIFNGKYTAVPRFRDNTEIRPVIKWHFSCWFALCTSCNGAHVISPDVTILRSHSIPSRVTLLLQHVMKIWLRSYRPISNYAWWSGKKRKPTSCEIAIKNHHTTFEWPHLCQARPVSFFMLNVYLKNIKCEFIYREEFDPLWP